MHPTLEHLNKYMNKYSTLDQMGLADICRTFHPTVAECTFFSIAHGTFSGIHYITDQITNFGKFRKIEIIPSIFF